MYCRGPYTLRDRYNKVSRYIWITERKVHFDTCNYPTGRTSGQSVDAAMSAYPKGYEIKIFWHPISELDVLASIREPALFRAWKYLT